MKDTDQLIKSTFIYLIGKFSSKILIFLLLPFLSFYLSKEDLGVYDIVLTTVSLLVPFVSLQFSNAMYRWLLVTDISNKNKISSIISNCFYTSSLSVLLFLIGYNLFVYFFNIKYSFYIVSLVVTMTYLPFFQNIIRGLNKTKLYAISSVVNTILLIIFNICFLLAFSFRIEFLFVAIILANLLTILFLIFKERLTSFLSLSYFDKELNNKMLKYSLPLIPSTVSWWLINAADKFLILLLLSTDFNGIYAISTRFPTIIMLFNSVFILAWQDQVISSNKNIKEQTKFNTKVFDRFVNFEFGIVLLLITTSEFTVRFFVDSKFYDSYKYMPLLYLGAIFSAFASYYGAAYLREKKTSRIFISALTGGCLNLLIAYFLLKHIGLYASAIGTVISFLFIFLLRVYDTRNFFLTKIAYSKIIYLTIISLFFSYLVTIDNNYLRLSIFLISLVISFFLNKEILNIIKLKLLNALRK